MTRPRFAGPRTWRWTCVCFLIILAWATPRAGIAQPSQRDRERAATHYQRGTEYFKQGDYELALGEYQRAHELAPTPLLLFNIGLVQRARGDHEAALAAFRAFLDQQPDGAIANEAREYLRELEAIAQAQAREREAQEREAREREAHEREAEAALDPARTPSDTGPDANAGRTLRLTGLGLIIAGSAVLGTGVAFGWNARSLSQDLSDHTGPWTDAELDRIQDGERAERNALLLTATGGAVLIAGGISYWLGVRSRRAAHARASASISLAPAVAHRRALLSLTGSF
jgi:tetratricopeptide (TPR) repeat protein